MGTKKRKSQYGTNGSDETRNRKTENEGEYRNLKDNQLWEKQDEAREESGDIDKGEEAQADRSRYKKAWVPRTHWYKPGTRTNFSLTR